jgi:hypothetical protein
MGLAALDGMKTSAVLQAKYGALSWTDLQTDVTSATALPVGRWVCVEWEVAPTSKQVHVWMDSQELDGLAGWSTGIPQSFKTLGVGAWRDQAALGVYELWVDDVVVSLSRVGCACAGGRR